MRGRDLRSVTERLRRLVPCLGLLLLLAAFQTRPPMPPPSDGIAGPHVALTGSLLAQSDASAALAKGKFLIASHDLRDANFVETVILLLDYNESGAMGLIINRETDVKLSELLPEVQPLEKRDDMVFVGGPVAKNSLLMLVRSKAALDDAKHVFGDVYASASSDLLERLAANQSRGYRAYVGYAGWGPGQLDREFETGSWHVAPAQSDTVFDPSPSEVWRRLIRRTTLQFASTEGRRPPA